ncbi:hypothetical protein TH61_15155 [Rufibacter sp. DG15C]|nr:hypothetical protein TH61_15155 [Rufibacter sp. DG15C]
MIFIFLKKIINTIIEDVEINGKIFIINKLLSLNNERILFTKFPSNETCEKTIIIIMHVAIIDIIVAE